MYIVPLTAPNHPLFPVVQQNAAWQSSHQSYQTINACKYWNWRQNWKIHLHGSEHKCKKRRVIFCKIQQRHLSSATSHIYLNACWQLLPCVCVLTWTSSCWLTETCCMPASAKYTTTNTRHSFPFSVCEYKCFVCCLVGPWFFTCNLHTFICASGCGLTFKRTDFFDQKNRGVRPDEVSASSLKPISVGG